MFDRSGGLDWLWGGLLEVDGSVGAGALGAGGDASIRGGWDGSAEGGW